MIAIIAAMEQEIKYLKDNINLPEVISWQGTDIIIGKLFGGEVVATITGVGKVLTAINLQHIIDVYSPSAIIMTGIAGAINPKLQKGDIFVAKEYIQHDFDSTFFGFKRGEIPIDGHFIIESDKNLLNAAMQNKKIAVKTGRILTGDQFIYKSDTKEYCYLTEELKGDAVDMEGAAAALCAKINKVPFLLIKGISDTADGKPQKGFKRFLQNASKRNLIVIKEIFQQIKYGV